MRIVMIITSLLNLAFLACAVSLDDFYTGSPELIETNTAGSILPSTTQETSTWSSKEDEFSSAASLPMGSGNPGPEVVITNPVPGQHYNDYVLIQGTASDDDQVARVELKIDAGEYYVAFGTTTFQFLFENLTFGSHTLYVRATDGAGDVSLTEITFEVQVDNTKPQVTIEDPDDLQTIAGTWEISGIASDNHSLHVVEISVDGNPYEAAIGLESWMYTTHALTNGNHTIYVRARDAQGNESMDAVVVYVENNPPNVVIINPVEGSTEGGLVSMGGTAEDSESGVNKIEVQIDDMGWNEATGTTHWSYDWNSAGYPSQDYTVYVRATDEVGNVSAEESVEFHLGEWSQKGGAINNEDWAENDSNCLVYEGIPYVALSENTGTHYNIFVKKWDGGSWVTLGGASINRNTAKNAYYPRLAVDDTTDAIYVTWKEQNASDVWTIYCSKWDGASWTPIGGAINKHTTRTANYPDIDICPDATPYPVVTFSNHDGSYWHIYVKKWTGGSWDDIGGSVDTYRDSNFPRILYINTTPYILFQTCYTCCYNYAVDVRYWNGSAWVQVNGYVETNNYNTFESLDMDKDSSNMLYVTYSVNPGIRQVYVERNNGGWERVGGSLNEWTEFFAHEPSIAIDPTTDNPYVSFVQWNPGFRWLYTKNWNGTDWTTFGGQVLNDSQTHDTYSPSLWWDTDSNIPYVSWAELLGTGVGKDIYLKHY